MKRNLIPQEQTLLFNGQFKMTSNGDSIWFDHPRKTFFANEIRITFSKVPVSINPNYRYASMDVLGSMLFWDVYTDTGILESLKNILPDWLSVNGYKLISVNWSEQGMQMNNFWNFDLTLEKLTANI